MTYINKGTIFFFQKTNILFQIKDLFVFLSSSKKGERKKKHVNTSNSNVFKIFLQNKTSSIQTLKECNNVIFFSKLLNSDFPVYKYLNYG